MTEERHHTDAEYDELKAKLDHAQRRIEELCLWGRAGEDDRKELRAKLDEAEKAWKKYQHDWEDMFDWKNRLEAEVERLRSPLLEAALQARR